MSLQTGDRLNFREAAQLIYRTQQPTPEQIERVRLHIANRELVGDSRGTAAAHVADFLARTAAARQREARRDAPRGERRGADLDRVYHESLKDFFLAVIFRRKVQGASARFQRAVVAAQIAAVVVVLAAVIFSVRSAFPPLAPERAAVLDWLAVNAVKSRINHWHTPSLDEQGRTRLRVEYHYTTEQGKGVDTDRLFIIAEGKVVSVESEW